MPRLIRLPRTAPKGRPGHGFYLNEFVAYADNEGRADSLTCPHDIFLDHEFPWTHICLECGSEFTTQTDQENAVTLRSGDQILINSTLRPDSLAVEGVLLTDAELQNQRHRWHAIWGLDGWTATGPEFKDAVPPPRLKGLLSGMPEGHPKKAVTHAHKEKK